MSENSYESRVMNYILKYLFIFLSNQLSVLSFSMSNVTVRGFMAILMTKIRNRLYSLSHTPKSSNARIFIDLLTIKYEMIVLYTVKN